MKVARWKVKMVRMLTNKISPDVVVKSSFDYVLPDVYCDMLDGVNYIEEPYREAILADVALHIVEEFSSSGFYATDLVPNDN